jgi:PAS domain S-box-containing protein
MKHKLSKLIDTEKSQNLLNSFCDAVGIAAAVIDLDGEVLVESRWQKVCTDFHRVNKQTLKKCMESDTQLANELQQGKQFSIYQCRNGLTDAASPIIIEGEHVANAFVGQFFLESPDHDFFFQQAATYGFETKKYLDSLNKVPIVMAEKLPAILNFLTTFAEMVAVMGIDRMKQIEATKALKENEAIFRTIVEHSNEMFYIHDTEHVLTYASPTSENLLGYTPEEMMINWTKLATDNPLNQKGIRFTEKAILTGEKQAPYFLELRKKSGELVLLEIDESPVKDLSGKVVAILGAARDVTEQKKIQQKLLKSEKGFRDLFDSITDLIYTQDLEGRFISANHAMSSVFGYEKDAFMGRRASEFMEPEMKTYFESEYLEKIKTKGYVEGITVYFTKTGKKKYIEYRSSLIEPEDGLPYISGSGRDVTERVLSQRKIKRLQKQIVQSQKMEAMGLMAGGVAHDLNNILSGIVSYPELLLMGLPEDSPLKKPIQTIYESGKRAADVVADLLTMARGVATGKEVLNLNDTIREYMLSPEHRNLENSSATVRFKTEPASDLLNMNGSITHIRKALMNLVINASEAIEGSGTVTIATMNRYLDEPLKGYRDVRTGEYVMLTVSDDGSGIPPKDLERIFEPFYTKKIMGRSGTGLGLAVVWNTVQEHNGYINVEASGPGTVFELYFPVTRDESVSEKEQVPLKDYLGHGEKILVVDDEAGQREIACNMLAKLGYKPEAVSSGEEAVQYVKESPVDLIVLDMIMPRGMNGRETYQEIIKIHPSQKAVIASGYAKTLEVDSAKKLGAGHYIKKPYTLEKIGIALKDELHG